MNKRDRTRTTPMRIQVLVPQNRASATCENLADSLRFALVDKKIGRSASVPES
jgi:hypothetical protein